MKRLHVHPAGLHPRTTCWVRVLSKKWLDFLHAAQPLRHPHRASRRGLTVQPPHGWSQASAPAFGMLVESDVLAGSRSMLP